MFFSVKKLKFNVPLLSGILFCLLSASPALAQQQRVAYPLNQAYQEAAFPMENSRTEQAYIIGPQNLLLIKILGESGIQSTFRVDDLGYITHPLVGRVQLAGRTVAQAEEMMRNVLDGDYIINPQVTIFVLEHSHFSVLGEVRKPGNYEITGQLSLVEAISIAGGFTPVANEDKVKILRQTEDGEVTLIVDVEAIMKGKQQDNVRIQAGDVINVSKSFF